MIQPARLRHRQAGGSLAAGGLPLYETDAARVSRWLAACAVLLAVFALFDSQSSAFADPTSRTDEQPHRLPPPGTPAWQPLLFGSIDRHTVYSRETHEGLESLVAVSNCSASGLVLRVSDVDLRRTPLLNWRWRVEQTLDIRHERTKNGDDFAARVYVMFRFDPSRASAFERLRHQIGAALYTDQIPGKTLNFVWTSRERPGKTWDNPFAKEAKMIALAQGIATEWRTETVDLVDHYERHFGTPVPEMIGLAVMTDSDNSCRKARAQFGNFSFSSRPTELPSVRHE